MPHTLPDTGPRVIYDRERAIELLGGHPGDAEALLDAGVGMARTYAMKVAVVHLGGEPAGEVPLPDQALFDYRTRACVDAVVTGASVPTCVRACSCSRAAGRSTEAS